MTAMADILAIDLALRFLYRKANWLETLWEVLGHLVD